MKLNIDGRDYTVDASQAEIAALGATRARVMDVLSLGEGQEPDTPLSERPGYIADDVTWLQGIVQEHCTRTSEPPMPVIQRCLASWAGQPAPAIAPVEPLSPEAQKAALKAYAITKRWQAEVGGTTVNGIPVPTDDRAKLLLLGAAQSMADGSSAPMIIAGVNHGDLTKAQFQAINLAVVAHVQQTFPKLATAIEQIESGKITISTQIDEVFA